MVLAEFLVTLGVLFLGGLVADQLGRMTRLPRVTLLLILGVGAGNAGLDLIPSEVAAWFDELSIIALTMVAFLLGGALTRATLRAHGRRIFIVSVAVVAVTLLVITLGLSLAGLPFGLALILGAIATATAPAAMADVIRQSGLRNRFTETLKGIVAIDDLWGLIVFSLALVLAGQGMGWGDFLAHAAKDLGGAVLIGAAIGVPAAFLTGRVSPGEPLQAEAIGVVFLTAGFALWFDVSFLVAGMTAGALIANLAQHHSKAFHEIEHIQWPFMILFFFLAGATLELEAISLLGWAGVLFLVLRVAGRIAGGLLGGWLSGAPRLETLWYGVALLPQAGVAIGMALVASEAYPEWASAIMAFAISSTVVFEILGPPITLMAIRKSVNAEPDTEVTTKAAR